MKAGIRTLFLATLVLAMILTGCSSNNTAGMQKITIEKDELLIQTEAGI